MVAGQASDQIFFDIGISDYPSIPNYSDPKYAFQTFIDKLAGNHVIVRIIGFKYIPNSTANNMPMVIGARTKINFACITHVILSS